VCSKAHSSGVDRLAPAVLTIRIMPLSWHRITFAFPFADPPTERAIHALLAVCGQRAQQYPTKGFAIFNALESYRDDPQRSSQVYYFSPVAAQMCAEIIAPFSLAACDAPARNLENLSISYGDLMGSESWDLLK